MFSLSLTHSTWDLKSIFNSPLLNNFFASLLNVFAICLVHPTACSMLTEGRSVRDPRSTQAAYGNSKLDNVRFRNRLDV